MERSRKKWTGLILYHSPVGSIIPFRDAHFPCLFQRLISYRLPEMKGHHGSGIGHIFPEDKNRIVTFYFSYRRSFHRSFFQDIQDFLDQLSFSGRTAGIRPVRARPCSEQKIGVQGSLRRSDTDQVFTPDHFPDFIDQNFSRNRDPVFVFFFEGNEKTVFMIYIFISESSAVADEIPVHFLLVPAPDPAEGTVSFTGDDVASQGAIVADRWGIGEIPFSGIMFFSCFVGKDAGGADFD